MAFTGTVVYDDINYTITLTFDDQSQSDTFYHTLKIKCEYSVPDINTPMLFMYNAASGAAYTADKATIITILGGL